MPEIKAVSSLKSELAANAADPVFAERVIQRFSSESFPLPCEMTLWRKERSTGWLLPVGSRVTVAGGRILWTSGQRECGSALASEVKAESLRELAIGLCALASLKPRVGAVAYGRALAAIEWFSKLRYGHELSDRALDKCFEMGDGAQVVAAVVAQHDGFPNVCDLLSDWRVMHYCCPSLSERHARHTELMSAGAGWRATYEDAVSNAVQPELLFA